MPELLGLAGRLRRCARGSRRRRPGTASRGSRADPDPTRRAARWRAARAVRRGAARAIRGRGRSTARGREDRQPRRAAPTRRPLGAGVGEAGTRGDVEQQLDLVDARCPRRRRGAGVGKRDPSAREAAGRLVAQRVQQLGHGRQRREGAIAGAAVDEPGVRLRRPARARRAAGAATRSGAVGSPNDGQACNCSVTASQGA